MNLSSAYGPAEFQRQYLTNTIKKLLHSVWSKADELQTDMLDIGITFIH